MDLKVLNYNSGMKTFWMIKAWGGRKKSGTSLESQNNSSTGVASVVSK